MKKFLAVFMSVILLVSSVGGVIASAANKTDAQIAAKEFNSNKIDYSNEIKYVSKKDLEKLIVNLDGKLAELIKGADLRTKIYNDETATTLIKAIAGKLTPSISEIDSSTLRKNFPEAYKFLMDAKKVKGTTFANIEGVIPFGIENEEEFVLSVSATLNGVGQLVGMIVLTSQDMYLDYLLPFLESLHLGPLPTHASDFNRGKVTPGDVVDMVVKDVTATGCGIGTSTLKIFIPYLLRIIEKLEDAPLLYVLDIMPDVLTHYDAFAKAFSSLKLPSAEELIKTLLSNIEGVEWPSMDIEKLMNMANATVAESGATDGYCVRLNGDKPYVFMALVNYVGKVLESDDNKIAVGKFLADKLGVREKDFNNLINGYKTDDVFKIIAAYSGILDVLIEKILPTQNGFIAFYLRFIQIVSKVIYFVNNAFVA